MMGRRRLIAGVLVLTFAALSTAVLADDALDFLRKWDVRLKPSEGL